MDYYLYSGNELPEDFAFPISFLDLYNLQIDELDLDPWWFLFINEQVSKGWLIELKKQYPDRVLIPFAKLSYNDDIACFDGDDKSGNPKVLLIHSFASPGWKERGCIENFEKWLELAKIESIEYKEDCDGI